MKLKQISEKNMKELDILITESRVKAAELVISMRTAKVSNVKELHQIKRQIAQALTIKRQRELAEREVSNG